MKKKTAKESAVRRLINKAPIDPAAIKDKLLSTEAPEPEAGERITNDTVAEHREEVLSVARRFIYPLGHSRGRIIKISIALILAFAVISSAVTALLLYRYKHHGNFVYRVTQVLPFPVARVNGEFISYEDYLFELRSGVHYQHTKENVDFGSEEGRKVLASLRERSLDKAKLNALALKAAADSGVNVTSDEVEARIGSIREENGLTDEALRAIIKEYYNWNLNDLRKDIRIDLTYQKLPRAIDKETFEEAGTVYDALQGGANFGKLAKRYSDHEGSKNEGGRIGIVEATNKSLPAEFVEAVFELKKGETSEPVESAFGLHIIRINKVDGKRRDVSQIFFRFKDANNYLSDQLKNSQVNTYIKL